MALGLLASTTELHPQPKSDISYLLLQMFLVMWLFVKQYLAGPGK
jgi:hypothetical protein